MSTDPWGRVDDDGTVYVRTAEGERAVGSWQAGEPEEALAYFHRKFDELAGQVSCWSSGSAAPTCRRPRPRRASSSCARPSPTRTRSATSTALLAPARRPDGAGRPAPRGGQGRPRAGTRARPGRSRSGIVAEAERIADETTHWKTGGERLRQLVEEWKAADRIDRVTEAALWKRLSAARTAFAKRRKAYFAGLDEQREGVRAAKERIVAEAEALAGLHRLGRRPPPPTAS